jgi:hypothetical protein
MTPARSYFAKRQKRYPLRGFDRAQYLYQVLKSELPEELRNLVSSGTVVIGELTRNRPEIQTVPIDGNGAVIEFNSGMMDFFYAVIRTLAGSVVRVTESGEKNEPAVPVTDVARDTAALFKQWKWPNSLIWTVRRIRYPPFPITDWIGKRSLEFSTYTELFLLAHELGHVEMDCGIVPQKSENVEVRADEIGCKILFGVASRGIIDLANLYGAAVLAVRVCAGLEYVGFKFSQSYPKQPIRLQSLRSAALSFCPSVQYFHEISRIGVAYQDQMDDVENHFDKHPGVRAPDGERLLVRFMAELLDVPLGRLSTQALAEDIIDLEAQTDAAILRQALRTLYEYYVASPPADSFIDVDMRRRMGQSLVQVMKLLPKEIEQLFSN